MNAKPIIKKLVKVTTQTTGTVAGARIGALLSVPLATRGLELLGIPQRVGAGVKAFCRDAFIGFHAVGGFCLGNALGEYIGKKIG